MKEDCSKRWGAAREPTSSNDGDLEESSLFYSITKLFNTQNETSTEAINFSSFYIHSLSSGCVASSTHIAVISKDFFARSVL